MCLCVSVEDLHFADIPDFLSEIQLLPSALWPRGYCLIFKRLETQENSLLYIEQELIRFSEYFGQFWNPGEYNRR